MANSILYFLVFPLSGDTGSGKKKTAANATGTVSGTSAKKATSLQKGMFSQLVKKKILYLPLKEYYS